jgi:hypothetical protein
VFAAITGNQRQISRSTKHLRAPQLPLNAKLSRGRRGLSADETGSKRIAHRHRKQKGRRLSAPAQS